MSNVKANTKKPKRDKYTWLGKVWKRLETSGFGMILNFLFWKVWKMPLP